MENTNNLCLILFGQFNLKTPPSIKKNPVSLNMHIFQKFHYQTLHVYIRGLHWDWDPKITCNTWDLPLMRKIESTNDAEKKIFTYKIQKQHF